MVVKTICTSFLICLSLSLWAQESLSTEEKLQPKYALTTADFSVSQSSSAKESQKLSATEQKKQWAQQLKRAEAALAQAEKGSAEAQKIQKGIRRLGALLQKKKAK